MPCIEVIHILSLYTWVTIQCAYNSCDPFCIYCLYYVLHRETMERVTQCKDCRGAGVLQEHPTHALLLSILSQCRWNWSLCHRALTKRSANHTYMYILALLGLLYNTYISMLKQGFLLTCMIVCYNIWLWVTFNVGCL